MKYALSFMAIRYHSENHPGQCGPNTGTRGACNKR